MAVSGYLPSRDQMIAIGHAARALYRVARRWQAFSDLPGYPIERGNAAALEALFALERALNPRCLAWHQPARRLPATECWPSIVADGLVWARKLLDLVLERNQLQSLATAATLAEWVTTHPGVPTLVSIQGDELKSLRVILRLLPRQESLLESVPKPHRAMTPATIPVSLAESLTTMVEAIPAPVLLMNPSLKPRVLGQPKERLTAAQYQVVKALLDAGENGLSKAELEHICGDAVNVLKRLSKSDPDWNSVIRLAGKKGYRYRIVTQAEQGASPERTVPAKQDARPEPAITHPVVG